MTFNPESEEGWINDFFFPAKHSYEKDDGSHTYIKSTVKKTLLLHTTYQHNDFCSPGNIDVIKGLEKLGKESNYYRVYVLGLWGNALKGLVFENINYVDEFPDIEDCGTDFLCRVQEEKSFFAYEIAEWFNPLLDDEVAIDDHEKPHFNIVYKSCGQQGLTRVVTHWRQIQPPKQK